MNISIRKVVRLFYPYGATRRVLAGPAKGIRFVVEPGIGFTYAVGTSSAAPRFFGLHVREGMTVYDVGANKGQMAMLFAKLVGESGCVAAFEPAEAEFQSLRRNVNLNNLHFVRTHRVAVTDVAGDCAFVYHPDHPTQGKLLACEPSYVIPGGTGVRVPGRTLDSFSDQHGPPDFIKIDVEGAAGFVLRGAANILDRHAPVIFIELHGPEEQLAVKDLIESHGYVVQTLTGKVVREPTVGWHNPLFCRPERTRRSPGATASDRYTR